MIKEQHLLQPPINNKLMTRIYLLLLLLCVGQLFAQDTIFFDRSWHKTERKLAHYYRLTDELEKGELWEYKDYFLESNKIQYVGCFTSIEPQKRTKTHVWYYENGKKKIEGKFTEDKRQGVWTYFYESGQKKKQGSFKEGFRSGDWVWWHEDGTAESEATYTKGKIQNERLWYFTDGKLFRKGAYQNGEKSGEWVSFYNNGQKESVEKYEKGIIKGEKKSWYDNGKIKSQEVYIKGILSDNSRFYAPDGEVVDSKTVLERRLNYNLLWEISGNGLEKPSYLMGTMHVKDPRAFQFSDSLIAIFSGCEAFSMEIHPDSVFDYAYSETPDQLLKHDYIAKASTRSKDYSEDWNPWVDQDLFGSRNSWERSAWVMNINQLFHRDHKVFKGMPYFLDAYLYTKARNQGKVCVGQEDIKDHIEAGKDLPKYNKNFDILSRFDPSEEMISVYEEGNIEKIRAFSNFLSSEEFNYRLLTIRNYKMAASIDSLIRLHTTFNTMGAAHLPGEEGVIEILKQKGYTLRAVKAPVASENIIVEGDAYQANWELLEDKRYGYQIRFPRQPILFEKDKELTYMSPDLVNETSYIAYALDLTFDETFDGKLSETFIAKYFNRKEAKLGFTKVMMGKKKGFEIQFFKKTYRGPKTFYRYRIFAEGRNLYFIGVGSLKEDRLIGETAFKFFNSFAFSSPTLTNQKLEWTTVTDTIGAFSFSIPTNYQYKNATHKTHSKDRRGNRGMMIYQSFDTLTGNTFSLRFRTNKMDEEEYFESIQEVYESYFGNFVKHMGSDDIPGSRSATYEFTIHENNHVYIKAIHRGTRTYLALAMIKDGDTEKAQEFLNEVKLVRQQVSALTPCYFTNEKITVSVPSSDTIWETDYSFYLPTWKLDDEEELVYSFQSMEKTSKTYSFSDSLNGVDYQFKSDHFSKYAYVDSVGVFIHQKATTMYDDEYELLDSVVTVGEIPTYTYLFKNIETDLLYKRRYVIIDTMLLALRVKYPKELEDKLPIDEFLNSYQVDSLQQTDFISQRKTQQLLDDLCDKEVLVRAEAKGALAFYSIKEEELPLVYAKYEQLPADFDTLIRPIITEEFIDILSQSNDEKSISYLFQWMNEMQNPEPFELMRLYSAISKIDLDTAITMYFTNVEALDTLDSYHYPLFYAKQIFQPYRDSSELMEADFDRLLTLLDFKNSSQLFVYVTDELFDNEDFDGSFMKGYSEDLLTQINRRFVLLDSLKLVALEEEEQEKVDAIKITKPKRRGYHNDFSYATETIVTYDGKEVVGEVDLYGNHVLIVKNLCYLINKLEIEPDSLLVTNLITSDETDLQMIAFRMFVKQEMVIPQQLFDTLLSNDEVGYKAVGLLIEKDRIELLPKEYATKEAIIKLQLTALAHKNSYRRVKKTKLLEVQKHKIGDEKGLLYIYEVIYETRKGRYIAVIGLQPKSEDEINYIPSIRKIERLYMGQDIEELIGEIIKKYEEDAAENWEDEYGIE
jgi:antitoxin component YwqK of YwqJK toxin-antitoxin module/uncharacterized protein YbaP (TraB family)